MSEARELVEILQILAKPFLSLGRLMYPQLDIYVDADKTYDVRQTGTPGGEPLGPAQFLHLMVFNRWPANVKSEAWLKKVEIQRPDSTFGMVRDFNARKRLKWANEPEETGFGLIEIEARDRRRLDLCYALEKQTCFHLYVPHEADGVAVAFGKGIYRLTVRVKPDNWMRKNIYQVLVTFDVDWRSLVFPDFPQHPSRPNRRDRLASPDLSSTTAWE